MPALHMLKFCSMGGAFIGHVSCDLLKFWEISGNISETVQDRHYSYKGALIGNHKCPIEWHQYR